MLEILYRPELHCLCFSIPPFFPPSSPPSESLETSELELSESGEGQMLPCVLGLAELALSACFCSGMMTGMGWYALEMCLYGA